MLRSTEEIPYEHVFVQKFSHNCRVPESCPDTQLSLLRPPHACRSCPTRAGLLSLIRADVISAAFTTELSQGSTSYSREERRGGHYRQAKLTVRLTQWTVRMEFQHSQVEKRKSALSANVLTNDDTNKLPQDSPISSKDACYDSKNAVFPIEPALRSDKRGICCMKIWIHCF